MKYQALAGKAVTAAVKNAAEKTGVDFSFLMQKAQTESSFDPNAKSKTSSATGLFQFVDQTWLATVKEHGAKYGLADEAAKIQMKDGKAVVADPKAKQEILNLRKDPEISALMAGEFCSDNQDYLESNTSCEVGATELYLAHFMGAGGAAKFLNSREVNGNAVAAQIFPAAAKANKSIFYDKSGQPRTLNQIYDSFAQKFSDGTSASPSVATAAPSARHGSVAASAAAVISSQDTLDTAAQTLTLTSAQLANLPSFDDADESDDIIWNDDPRFYGASSLSSSRNPLQKLSPVTIQVMSQMQETLTDVMGGIHGGAKESRRYNS